MRNWGKIANTAARAVIMATGAVLATAQSAAATDRPLVDLPFNHDRIILATTDPTVASSFGVPADGLPASVPTVSVRSAVAATCPCSDRVLSLLAEDAASITVQDLVELVSAVPGVDFAEPDYVAKGTSDRALVDSFQYDGKYRAYAGMVDQASPYAAGNTGCAVEGGLDPNIGVIGAHKAWQKIQPASNYVVVIGAGFGLHHVNAVSFIDYATEYGMPGPGLPHPWISGSDFDTQNHEALVSSIIAASHGYEDPVAGLSPGTRIIPARIAYQQGTDLFMSSSALIEAIRFYEGTTTLGGKSFPSSIRSKIAAYNVSYGFQPGSQALETLAKSISRPIVISESNSVEAGDPRRLSVPGDRGPIWVGGFVDHRAYSDLAGPAWTSHPEIQAYTGATTAGARASSNPGITLENPSYRNAHGNSFQAPIVAAAIAMMKGIYPSLNRTTFMQALRAGSLTMDVDGPGFDFERSGWGVIHFDKAAQWAMSRAGQGSPTPTLPPEYGCYAHAPASAESHTTASDLSTNEAERASTGTTSVFGVAARDVDAIADGYDGASLTDRLVHGGLSTGGAVLSNFDQRDVTSTQDSREAAGHTISDSAAGSRTLFGEIFSPNGLLPETVNGTLDEIESAGETISGG